MKSSTWIRIVVWTAVAIVLPILFLQVRPTQSSGKIQSGVTIEGVVIEAETGRQLEHVQVSLLPEGKPDALDSKSLATNDIGRFSFKEVPPGRYRVVPALGGFVFLRSSRQKALREPGIWIQVSEREWEGDIELRMVREGVVSGLVLDQNGQPRVGISVGLAVRGYDEYGKERLLPVPGLTTVVAHTDDRGEYRFWGLQPGDYYLYASVEGASTYWPGVSDESRASQVHVNGGEAVGLASMPVASLKLAQVRFHFADPEGVDLMFRQINLGVRGRADSVSMLGGRDRAVVEVPPGHYEGLVGSSSRQSELFYSHVVFDVGESDRDFNLAMSRGVRVDGSIVVENATDQKSGSLRVRCRLRSDSQSITVLGGSSCIGSQFSPGLYRLEIVDGLPLDSFIISATASGQDILAEGFDLKSDTSLSIVLAMPGAVLGGAVFDSKGNRIPDAVVALVPDAPLRAVGPFYRTVMSDVHGNFELRGIAPGAYHVFAWSDLAGAAYRNEEFMKGYDRRGSPIHFARGERASLDVTAFDGISIPSGL